MDHRAHFAMLADYNAWANRCLIDGLAPLSDSDWHADHGLFFKSIHATFNHDLLVEMLWLGRLAGRPWQGGGLDAVLDPSRDGLLTKLAARNSETQAAMRALPDPLPARIQYSSIEGKPMDMPLAPVLAHVFNHATHHRGQITAVAHRLGLRVQELDIPYFLHDAGL